MGLRRVHSDNLRAGIRRCDHEFEGAEWKLDTESIQFMVIFLFAVLY